MSSNLKTFFILPGFKTQVNSTEYNWLIDYLEHKGIRVIKTPIKWDHNVLSNNAAEFVKFFNKHKSKENYVLGFSYGAVLVLMTANDLMPNKIFLCSLSPTFKEDLRSDDGSFIRYIGKKRFEDLSSYSAKKLASNLKMPSMIFYGEQEGKETPQLKNRSVETAELSKNSRLIVVPNAPHKINDPEYQRAILGNLNL